MALRQATREEYCKSCAAFPVISVFTMKYFARPVFPNILLENRNLLVEIRTSAAGLPFLDLDQLFDMLAGLIPVGNFR